MHRKPLFFQPFIPVQAVLYEKFVGPGQTAYLPPSSDFFVVVSMKTNVGKQTRFIDLFQNKVLYILVFA